MSTIEDFRNAPVGTTATHHNGSRAMKIDGIERCWILKEGVYFSDEQMEYWCWNLDPAPTVPTTAREALELAWELAHEVKGGQVIPEGARYLTSSGSGVKEYTAQHDVKIRSSHATVIRTVDPLPEPLPDWLDAPAVLATCGCRGIELWHPHESKDGLWASSARGEYALWSTLRDVTPLYPEGQEA